ncbi:GNAT family N-acetyltransferase [Lactobacillus sp. ESL0731]|uniref:GNAT family N-acetyltransferase n=1 Tax=unclassified Lactobacillus TaxID=2620435 RepID=UPI0023F81D4D|nr:MULTISPECIES: GNAT family N-acetyltransferase [unclassified Lactobacillus]WEV51850.1 GNAT family N-acetyltransferase [Lactobacillus sp. ESL0700]WEV62980.1 GNAT family N-acetyltransferase [Lactobacillus sp. ESL0731]
MIRHAKITDSSAIQKINYEQLGYDYPLIKTQTSMQHLLADPHHLILVAEDAHTGKITGYVHAELYQETYFDPMLNIMALAVSSAAQHRGIGTALMTAVEEYAKEKQITAIRLNSSTNRTGAHQFYAKIGYSFDKTQKRFSKKLPSKFN